MSFEWFVARRYLTARRRQAFVSLITGVSIVGVGVGVMAVIIALALMTGVQGELRDRILGSDAHVYVYRTGGEPFPDLDGMMRDLAARPGVVGVAPATLDNALIAAHGVVLAVQFRGIDPALEGHVTDIDTAIRAGSLEALTNRSPDEPDGILLGTKVAEALSVRVGDPVILGTLNMVLTPGALAPKRRAFVVVGLTEFGFEETDANRVFITLASGEAMKGTSSPDMIQIRLADRDRATAVREALQDELGPTYFVQDWTTLNRSLYSALWLEKVAISFTIGLIVFVAALNIVASLVLMVMEKSRDIAILRTMGAPARAIRRIFMLQGLTIGLVGTGSGAALGLLVSWVMDRFQLLRLPSDVYQITHVPFRTQPLDVTIVVLAAVIVCYAATVYPSRQAGRLDPAEALRHE
ncbi:MAG: FtsX-like permease family protein [Vicinamibacterales bacterium]